MTIQLFFLLMLLLSAAKNCIANMEGFIVGGSDATIEKYPHSVLVGVECVSGRDVSVYLCGGSILNQRFIISAAHCFEDCHPVRSTTAVAVGSARKSKLTEAVAKILMHPQYNEDSISNDIAMMFLRRNLKFGPRVKKVMVLKNPPYSNTARLAGWGYINEEYETDTVLLQEASQTLLPRYKCVSRLGYLPRLAFCADNAKEYAAQKTHSTGKTFEVNEVADMEGFIVGGSSASIEKYPHSAFVGIRCVTPLGTDGYICGASILNQRFLLSAGHCFEDCDPDKSIAAVATGIAKKTKVTQSVDQIYMHENYNGDNLHNDISLMMLRKNLKFSSKVKRVLVMRSPPSFVMAYVAGWGLTNEERETPSIYLKEAGQRLVSRQKCLSLLKTLPKLAFCTDNRLGYAAQGDSGSALVIQNFIQIGLVSYKNVEVSDSLVVYTNVSAYYDWIRINMRKMAC